MRLLTPLALAATLALQLAPAFAQTAAPSVAPAAPLAPATAAPAVPSPTTGAPASAAMAPGAAATAGKHKRMSLQQRFEAANAAHDGHLTRDEASAAKWTYVVRHFDGMDKDKKGYLTVADIHGYAAIRHAARATHKAVTPASATPATTTPAAPATTN